MADELTDPTPDSDEEITESLRNYKPSPWKGTTEALAVRPGDVVLEPEAEGQLYWDSVQRALDMKGDGGRKNVLHTWHNPDGTVTMTANYLTEELREKYGTPADPNEGALFGHLVGAQMPLPTPAELDEFADGLGDLLDEIELTSPALANMLEKNPRLLFTMPELYGMLTNAFEDYGPAMAIADYLAADLNVINYENWSTAAEKGLPTAMLFDEIAPLLSQRELDILATVWAGQWEDDNQQDRLAGLAYRWLHPGGTVGDRDLRDEQTRGEFMTYVYEAGAEQQEFGTREQTGWGRFFEWTDRPREIVTGLVRDAWNFFAASGNPQEAAMRSELTVGQTMAWSMGYDPSERGWQNSSGFIDGASFIWGDPINLLVGAGLAAKISKTAAVSSKVASMNFGQKLVYAGKSFIPKIGRKLTTLPRGSRAPSVRFFHNLFGRTADELFEAATKNGVWDDMYKIMKGKRGLAGVIEKYPQMQPLLDGGASVFRRAKNSDEFAEIMNELRRGDWLGEDSAGYLRVLNELEDLKGLDETPNIAEEILRLEGQLYDIKASNRAAWVIADFPTKITPEWKLAVKPWRKLATNDSKTWWGQFRRTQAAKSLMQAHGKQVSFSSVADGATELRRFFAEVGASRQFVADALNEWYTAPRVERYETVAKLLVSAGEEIDHPLLTYALEQIVDKGGVLSHGMVDGAEVARGASRTREGVKVALPYMPSQLSDGYPLPGADFMKGVARYRQAKTFKVFGDMATGGKGLVRGLSKKTGQQRKRLVDLFSGELTRRGVDVVGLGEDELYMMAYAKASAGEGIGSGLGQLANIMHRANTPFRKFHEFFTTMQLATRPVTWMMRVALLEEGIRAQFFDLPSFYAHPIRYISKFNEGVVTARVAVHRAKFFDDITEVVGSVVPRGTKFDKKLMLTLEEKLPEWAAWVGDTKPQGIIQLRSSLATFLQGAMDDAAVFGGFERAGYVASSAMKRRVKKIDKANVVFDRLGLNRDFEWGVDAAGMLNHGFISMLKKQVGAGAQPLEYLPGQMTDEGMIHFANGWAQQVLRHIDDPIAGRYGLGRAAARAEGLTDSKWNAERLVRSKAWGKMEPTVRRIAEERGWQVADELGLAERYLTDVIDPVVDDLFAPLFADAPAEAGRIADELGRTRDTTLSDGTAFRLGGSNHGQIQNTLREWAILNKGRGLPFPKRVTGMMDPKMFFDESASAITQSWQKFSASMLRIFGEEATQTLNRRPAWLSAFADNYKYYHETLGLTEEVAREMAKTEATKIANYVFYNLDNGSPYLKAMNRNIPFFGAFWEVSQTWAYKIPMAHNSAASAPALVRKLDRAFTALQSLGLIERENQWNPDGSIKESTMYLTFDEDPHTGTQLGDVISKAGHIGLGLPRTLVRALVGLRNLLPVEDFEVDDMGMFKDKVMYQIGNPLATAGDQSHGIMAVNQVYLGMDPLKSYLLNQIRNRVGFAADTQLLDANEGESLLELADRMDADVRELIRDNPANLREKLGADGYARLLRGVLQPEEVMLDGSEYFEIPNSSFMDQWMDQFIFPFGVEDSMAGNLYNLTPSWFPYFLRGLGMWNTSGEDWAVLDPETGEVKMPTDFAAFPLLEIATPPIARMQIVGEINKQLLHLESSEGLISQWKQELNVLESMSQEAAERGLVIQEAGGEMTIENVISDPEYAELWLDQKLYIQQLNAQIIKRAIDNAGGAMVFRGIAGAMSPGNPRSLFEEEKIVEQYWDARDLAAGDIRGGSANWKLPKTLAEFEIRQGLVSEFLADESGDQAKDWLKENYPEIAVFTSARTFWVPGGKAPEIDSIEAYFEAVDAGLRSPLPPSVLQHKMTMSDITVGKHLAIDAMFDPANEGPWQAAANIVNDWPSYKTILDEAAVAYASMEWWDQEVNGGQYDRWRSRNADDQLTLAEEVTRRYDRIAEAVDYLEEFAPSPDMTPKDRRDYVNALKNAARGFRDFIGDWNEEIEGTWLDSPREQALNWYFDNVQAPYYEKLADLYDGIDDAMDSEDQSRIYEEIRQFSSKEFQRKYYSVGGVEFPNALEFSWNKKDTDEQSERILRWIANKPEWLGLDATARLVAQSPDLGKYLPSRPDDFKIYEEYNAMLIQLADDQEPDRETGKALLTASQYTKAKHELDRQFRLAMIAENRLAELEYLDMYPIERLALAGLLPRELEPFAEMAVGVKQELARIDKSPGSNAGQAMFNEVYIRLQDAIDRDPRLWNEVLRPLLLVMYDAGTLDKGFGQLFYDDRFGEI